MSEVTLSTVASRVRDILDTVDQKVTERYGDDLPEVGSRLLTIRLDAEDDTDVEAVKILESRGLAKWVGARGVGASFEVEAAASLRSNATAGQTKATLGLAARIDALEGLVERLVGQNERLLAIVAAAEPKAKALPAKKTKAAKKKGGARG